MRYFRFDSKKKKETEGGLSKLGTLLNPEYVYYRPIKLRLLPLNFPTQKYKRRREKKNESSLVLQSICMNFE